MSRKDPDIDALLFQGVGRSSSPCSPGSTLAPDPGPDGAAAAVWEAPQRPGDGRTGAALGAEEHTRRVSRTSDTKIQTLKR